jgi:hypothetical protein
MHIRILKCWRSIWCLWYGLNSQERWVGSPIGNVRGFPVGSWSLHLIWKQMSTYARCQSIAAVDVMVFQNLHHMYWCGVLGEDYDGFICVMNSNLFLLTRMIVVSLCFPKFSQRGFYRGFIMNECTLMMIFVQVFSQWGFLGLYFMLQSKMRSLSIGVPYWLEGSVWWYCCGIM